MTLNTHAFQTEGTGLDMDLELSALACMAQLPSLAARRLRAYQDDIVELQATASQSPSAQRLARKLFSLLANASVHCGGAATLRPLFEHCALVRAFLWLDRRTTVTAPEPLVRGTPDLVIEVAGASIWIDTRVRSPDVVAERGRQAALLVDRTASTRREPPLRLGAGYAGEFHLLDARGPGASSEGTFELEQQFAPVLDADVHWVQALAVATGACDRRNALSNAGLGHRA